MNKVDYHLHTEYSYDSKLKAEDLIVKAIQLNYSFIAITEHLDLLPQELSAFGLPPFKKYVRRMKELREKYASEPLCIVCGIEVGDFQRVRLQANDLLAELDLELRLGAVHFLSDHTNVAIPLPKPLDQDQTVDYYRQNLTLVETCDIDVLAHLGVHKRYYSAAPDESDFHGLLKDIFQTMIERRIALEINFSGLRKRYNRILPEPEQIELYRELGGNLFTLGSDAHQPEDFDAHYESLPGWLFGGGIRFPALS